MAVVGIFVFRYIFVSDDLPWSVFVCKLRESLVAVIESLVSVTMTYFVY